MLDLWDSGPSLPTPGGLERNVRAQTPDPAQQSPTVDIGASGLSPAVAVPMVFGLEHAYGPAWQQDYGMIAGRTLTGATPAEAFPDASTPERQQYRDALAHILSPGQQGADHPDVQAVMRGALADGMTQADRAVVNRAAIDAAVERDPRALLEIGPEVPQRHLTAWSALAQHRIPRSVQHDLRQINENYRTDSVTEAERVIFGSDFIRPPGTWRVRPVESAAGPEVNLDYYSVTVQRMPPGVSPGQLLAGLWLYAA